MELTNMDILSDELCDNLERVFKARIGTISIYDIDDPNQQALLIFMSSELSSLAEKRLL